MPPFVAIRRVSLRSPFFARLASVALVLAISGCATGLGGYPSGGSYPGSSYPDQRYPQPSQGGQLIGTVQSLDARGGRILLETRASGYGGASRVDVYFDQRTQLVYQGQAYPVSGLEPGDEIRIATSRSGDRLWASSIEVLRNVRDSGGYNNGGYDSGGYNGGSYNGGGYNSGSGDLRGEVGYVDTRGRIIELARGPAGVQRLRYDERTVVEYQGQRYRPENLQRGDVIRIQARQYGNDLVAERIWVEGGVNRR